MAKSRPNVLGRRWCGTWPFQEIGEGGTNEALRPFGALMSFQRVGSVMTVPRSWRTFFVTVLFVLAIQSFIYLPQDAFAGGADITRVQSQAEHGSVAQENELG